MNNILEWTWTVLIIGILFTRLGRIKMLTGIGFGPFPINVTGVKKRETLI